MKKLFSLFIFCSCIWTAANVQAQTVDVWITKGDQSQKLQQQNSISFNSGSSGGQAIQIDPASTFQSIDGFGFALTQGSAEALSQLNSSTRDALLNELFNPTSGNSISVVRISIGASDLSNSVYSYNETNGDVAMNNFSLAGPDQTYLIPILQEILAINPQIKVLATPWTAPTWMKTNGTWIGGSLLNTYYAAYATYFVKYLDAMANLGINIWAITPQNEPEYPGNEPSMLMTSSEQIDFINNHLGPAITNSSHSTKIIAYDHNCDNTAYPIDVLNNSSYVDGAAFHLYQGNIFAMSTVKNQTGKNVYFTEQFTSTTGNFGGDLSWHMQNVVIGSLRNWSKTVIEWNLATNASFGPRTPGGCTECLGAITVNGSQNFDRNVSYYIVSQIAKFVKPGAIRIGSNLTGSIQNVAFQNPDGSIALLAFNTAGGTTNFAVNYNGNSFSYSLDGGSAATFIWSGGGTNPSTIDAFSTIQAESFSNSLGIQLENTSDTGGGQNVGWTDTNDFIAFNNVDFDNGAQSVEARVASNASFTGTVEFRLGSTSGNLIGTVSLGNTGGWQSWVTRTSNVSNTSGVHDLYLVFKGGSGIGNLNWIRFQETPQSNPPAAPSGLSASATSSSSISLNWTDNSSNESGFEIQSSPNNSSWSTLATLSANNQSYTHTGLSTATTFYYRVRAENNDGLSSWSNIASATTNTVPTGIANGLYSIINVGSGKSLDVANVSTTNGARIQQWTYSGGGNQQWNVESLGNDEYKITASHSGKSLDVVNASNANGTEIQQWDYFGSANQKWKIESVGGGNYRIVAVHSNKSLQVKGKSNANGALIEQRNSTNSNYQKWQLTLLSTSRTSTSEVILNVNEEEGFNVYPNPVVNGKLNIRMGSVDISAIQITDLSGKELFRMPGVKKETEIQIDLSKYASGTYLLKLESQKGSMVKQIIIR